MIPLHDGMVLSFGNYEVKINLEPKDESEFAEEDQQIRERFIAMHDS